MKNLITPTYTFIPGSAGVGTLAVNIVDFDIRLLYAVLNITRGGIIYATGRSGFGYTALSGNTLTLQNDTASMGAGDVLQFLYDSTPAYPISVSTGQAQALTAAQLAAVELTESVRQMQCELEILRNTIGQTRVDGGGRLRVLIDQISGALTLGTVSTVTNQTSIGGIAANDQVPALRRLAADTLLSKISIT